jgi:hypothetical protein
MSDWLVIFVFSSILIADGQAVVSVWDVRQVLENRIFIRYVIDT